MHQSHIKPVIFQNVLWCLRQNMASVGIIGYRAFCARLHIPKDCNIMASP